MLLLVGVSWRPETTQKGGTQAKWWADSWIHGRASQTNFCGKEQVLEMRDYAMITGNPSTLTCEAGIQTLNVPSLSLEDAQVLLESKVTPLKVEISRLMKELVVKSPSGQWVYQVRPGMFILKLWLRAVLDVWIFSALSQYVLSVCAFSFRSVSVHLLCGCSVFT